MGLLVGTMDIATANNTVAIVMANPIAKEMSEDYDITPRKEVLFREQTKLHFLTFTNVNLFILLRSVTYC